MPEIAKARSGTAALIALIIRGLRSGKSPKEIAAMTKGAATYSNIQVIIHRYPEVHDVFVETYHIRYPHRESRPAKMANSFREV